MEHKEETTELVTLSVDGVQVKVPKGTNLIVAAKTVGIDIPYYCWHKHLSVAGNCRMCQVEITGMPKLTIACNTMVAEGMEVKTHRTSEAVERAQKATLEFLLINHPLDCTVCDEAGHCKLQDYFHEYSSKASRFVEEKVHQVKAKQIGPEIMFDGERCIVCTRCVRFCDEVTKTGELGVFERGDRSVIGTEPGRELDNPFSGSVVDLCPVGALTHKRWRFNTRIWYTKETDTICSGCSTGCNAKVAVRDGQVVFVKARLNSEVNEEWMCDEGRYGFEDYQPKNRLVTPLKRNELSLEETDLEDGINEAASLLRDGADGGSAVFLSPRLTLEEISVALNFADVLFGVGRDSDAIAVQCVTRELSELESLLISPDYAPNARALDLLLGESDDNWRERMEQRYLALLEKVKRGEVRRLVLVGDGAIRTEDLDAELCSELLAIRASVSLGTQGVLSGEAEETEAIGAHQLCQILLPARTVLEKSGVFVSAKGRVQRVERLLEPPFNTMPEWLLLDAITKVSGKSLFPEATPPDERALFFAVTESEPKLSGLTLREIGSLGRDLLARQVAQAEEGK